MGVVQLRQIKGFLEKFICPLIDISDYSNRSIEEQENARLSRGLAALAMSNIADLSLDHAAASVIDGFNDNGLDAVHYSSEDKTLYLCQSKWSGGGNDSIDLGSTEKFIRGVQDMLSLRLEVFNNKVKTRKDSLEIAINEAVKVQLIVAFSGSEKLGDHPARILRDLLSNLNDTGEVASLHVLDQGHFYAIVSSGGRGDPVDIAMQLFDWGQAKTPYQAFYGQVAASDVAQWGAKWRQKIFSKNIRSFLGVSTSVNEGIAETLRKTPQQFWYLNNGITALCSKITKRAVGGNSRDAGTFECQGVAIVNGAQTVGAITDLGEGASEQLAAARVPIRIISLEDCPPEFANEVTRATNTQNRVDARNFVALDPEQSRLRAELLVDGIDYEYRQGEGEPSGDKRFGLVEATVALACSANTADLAVQAKREISKLWEDLGRPPYKLMFNSGLSSIKLWNLVQILREIDTHLDFARSNEDDSKIRSIAINGNRLIAHIVYKNLVCGDVASDKFDVDIVKEIIEDLCNQALNKAYKVLDEQYGGSYLANLFKNLTKCRDVVDCVGIFAPDQSAIDRRRHMKDHARSLIDKMTGKSA